MSGHCAYVVKKKKASYKVRGVLLRKGPYKAFAGCLSRAAVSEFLSSSSNMGKREYGTAFLMFPEMAALYEQREWAAQASLQILERPDMMVGYQNIFIAITLIVAMFMGCTFNAMNIISEKEDGVALINEILPMTHRQYMMQKIFVGFVFGCLSAILTAAICFRLSFTGAAIMLALIVLSAFVSALIGLFVGKLSDGMMVGVVYIKIVMIVFMAVPILNYLVGAGNKALSYICYLIPSSATFEGIMDLANGTASTAAKDTVILALHCVLWFLLYLLLSKQQRKHI